MVMFGDADGLSIRLGRTFTPAEQLRAEAILEDVSAHVASHTGTTFDDGATVPAAVQAVVYQVAGRNFGMPADRSGISQEGAGPFSYSVGSAAASGLFLPSELAVLSRHRVGRKRVGTINVTPGLSWCP
jgi:hypothetical protein